MNTDSININQHHTSQKYQVLVLDDDELVSESMAEMLEEIGIYSPVISNSGKEALQLVKENHFDAYLVDQRMPNMTGVEFTRELLKIDHDPLVYFVTAEDDDIAYLEAEKGPYGGGLPICQYINKPWNRAQFSIGLRQDIRRKLQAPKTHDDEFHIKRHSISESKKYSPIEGFTDKELYNTLAHLQSQTKSLYKKLNDDDSIKEVISLLKHLDHLDAQIKARHPILESAQEARSSKHSPRQLLLPQEPKDVSQNIFYHKKILIVDDDNTNRLILNKILAKLEARIDNAENGAIAVSKAQDTHYDIILMDIHMPVMDGLEATRQIRKEGPSTKSGIIALTAGADRDSCLEAGVDGYLMKPISQKILFSIMEKALMLSTAR